MCESDHYCVNDNKSVCEYIESSLISNKIYFKKNNGCVEECKNRFDYCLKCNETNCIECITYPKKNGECLKTIDNCTEYNKATANETYIECKKCDNDHGYYCIGDDKTACKKINISLYIKLDESDDYSCVEKCSDRFDHCETCNSSHCLTCQEYHKLENDKCLFSFPPPANDACNVLIHDIDFPMIKNYSFMYFMDYYFENTLSYTKYVDHFVNEQYTVTMFIYPECTKDLLNQGFYKIESTQLRNTMLKEAKFDNIYLFSIFINYNYYNYYRFQDLDSLYINPDEKCPSCKSLTFDITNKYIRNINNLLGSSTGSVVDSEHIDFFSEDSDIFTDPCTNLTIDSIDIPLKERLQLFYLHDYVTPIACGGVNCEIKETNIEQSTSLCTCKFDIKFEDIFNPPLPEFKNYVDENQDSKESSTFGTIKCIKNGFNGKNVLANGGFIIAAIALVAAFVLYLIYCICSKVINLPKGSNPPTKIKNRILLINDWQKNEKDYHQVNINDNSNNLIQSRDEDEGDLFEEDLTFSNRYDNSSYSIDSNYTDKKNEVKNKSNKFLSEKAGRRILVLIPNVSRRRRNDERRSNHFSDTEFAFIDKSKKRNKKHFCQIYWTILSLKQHIINFFSPIKCCKITDSFIPIPMRLIRSILIIVLALFINIFFLGQNYYSEKFKYFNEKYKLVSIKTDDYEIKAENTEEVKITFGETLSYAASHVFINSIISFAILLVLQFIICYFFFSIRKSVIDVIKRNDLDSIQDLVLKTRIKYILFFIITMVLLFIFLLFFIGFGASYGGGFVDYLIAGVFSLIFLQLFPFLWSLILAFLLFLGLKKGYKCCYQFSQFFIF